MTLITFEGGAAAESKSNRSCNQRLIRACVRRWVRGQPALHPDDLALWCRRQRHDDDDDQPLSTGPSLTRPLFFPALSFSRPLCVAAAQRAAACGEPRM